MSNVIKSIKAREILASNGTPTIEAIVELDNKVIGKASVPFGVSAGIHEAQTLLDEDKERYNGGGMLKAAKNINTIIAGKLVGMDVTKQEEIDKMMIELDGTDNKKRLGGNSILAVSLACARVAAKNENLEVFEYIRKVYKIKHKKYILPKPMMVVMEGGKHADNSTDFQEYLFSVTGAPNIREAVRWGEETYHALKGILKERGLNTNVGNEGAFAPSGIESNEKPLEMMVEAIKKAGYEPGKDISISLDPATSELYNKEDKKYILSQEGAGLTSDQMVGLFSDWINKYPILQLAYDRAVKKGADSSGTLVQNQVYGIEYVNKDQVSLIPGAPKRYLAGALGSFVSALILISGVGIITRFIPRIIRWVIKGFNS